MNSPAKWRLTSAPTVCGEDIGRSGRAPKDGALSSGWSIPDLRTSADIYRSGGGGAEISAPPPTFGPEALA